MASQSRAATPLPTVDTQATNESSGTRTSTPTSVRADGNIYLECLNCQRQVSRNDSKANDATLTRGVSKIASNRYAPHLSSCMGLGTGMRRGATRGSAKSKYRSYSRSRLLLTCCVEFVGTHLKSVGRLLRHLTLATSRRKVKPQKERESLRVRANVPVSVHTTVACFYLPLIIPLSR